MHSQAIGEGATERERQTRRSEPDIAKGDRSSRQVSPCALGQIENHAASPAKSNPTTKCASSWAMVPV